jgi:hypothetical protein
MDQFHVHLTSLYVSSLKVYFKKPNSLHQQIFTDGFVQILCCSMMFIISMVILFSLIKCDAHVLQMKLPGVGPKVALLVLWVAFDM